MTCTNHPWPTRDIWFDTHSIIAAWKRTSSSGSGLQRTVLPSSGILTSIENVVQITASKAGKQRRQPPCPAGLLASFYLDREMGGCTSGGCNGERARDIGLNAIVPWANVIAVGVDMLDGAGGPRGAIHEFLDRVEDANGATLSDVSKVLMAEVLETICAGTPGND